MINTSQLPVNLRYGAACHIAEVAPALYTPPLYLDTPDAIPTFHWIRINGGVRSTSSSARHAQAFHGSCHQYSSILPIRHSQSSSNMDPNSTAAHPTLGSDVSADTAQHSFLVQSHRPVQVNKDAQHSAITQDKARGIGEKVFNTVPSALPEDFPKTPSDQPFALPSCGGTGLFTRRPTPDGVRTLDHKEVRWPDGCVKGSYQVEQGTVDADGNKEFGIVDVDYIFGPDGDGVEELEYNERILKADRSTSVDSHRDSKAGPFFDPSSVHVVPTLVDEAYIPYIPRPLGSSIYTKGKNDPFADNSLSYRVTGNILIGQRRLQRSGQDITQCDLSPESMGFEIPHAGCEFPSECDEDIVCTTGFT
jgi:hypothetical protein